MSYSSLITIDPARRSGKPCVRDTRITVYDVFDYLASGMTQAEIIKEFPELTPDDIRACLPSRPTGSVRLMGAPGEAAVRPGHASLRTIRRYVPGSLRRTQPGGCSDWLIWEYARATAYNKDADFHQMSFLLASQNHLAAEAIAASGLKNLFAIMP
jgi:uncharacterized protein (DUF433 family)